MYISFSVMDPSRNLSFWEKKYFQNAITGFPQKCHTSNILDKRIFIMKKAIEKRDESVEKKRYTDDIPCLERLFQMLDERVELARIRAEQNISPEEQEKYRKYHKSEIECGLEFPFKGMKEDLRSDTDYSTLCYEIGICYFRAGKFLEARKWFISSIDLTPEAHRYNAPYVYLEKIRKEDKRSPI